MLNLQIIKDVMLNVQIIKDVYANVKIIKDVYAKCADHKGCLLCKMYRL